MAEEQCAVVLINLAPRLPVVGQQYHQMHCPILRPVAAVEDQHLLDRQRLAQVDLPPRIAVAASVKPILAIAHAIACPRRVFFGPDRRHLASRRKLADDVLPKPVRLDLLSRADRRLRFCRDSLQRTALEDGLRREEKQNSPNKTPRNHAHSRPPL